MQTLLRVAHGRKLSSSGSTFDGEDLATPAVVIYYCLPAGPGSDPEEEGWWMGVKEGEHYQWFLRTHPGGRKWGIGNDTRLGPPFCSEMLSPPGGVVWACK